jgi:hypothetical protein
MHACIHDHHAICGVQAEWNPGMRACTVIMQCVICWLAEIRRHACAQELFVLYRRKAGRNWLAEVKRRVVGPERGEGGSLAGPRLLRREPITLRVLRDIPGARFSVCMQP